MTCILKIIPKFKNKQLCIIHLPTNVIGYCRVDRCEYYRSSLLEKYQYIVQILSYYDKNNWNDYEIGGTLYCDEQYLHKII